MEIWKDIIGYDCPYQVSNFGRVKRLEHIKWVNKNEGFYRKNPEIIMKLLHCKNKKYVHVNLYKEGIFKSINVHRLVLSVFDREPLKDEVCMHLDNNPENNKLSNLKWGTSKENTQQMHKEGRNRDIRGSKNHRCKTSEEDIIKIKHMSKNEKLTVSEISKKINKSYFFIYEIVNNLKWKHISI